MTLPKPLHGTSNSLLRVVHHARPCSILSTAAAAGKLYQLCTRGVATAAGGGGSSGGVGGGSGGGSSDGRVNTCCTYKQAQIVGLGATEPCAIAAGMARQRVLAAASQEASTASASRRCL